MKPEKNPIKIIWLTKKTLLPASVWAIWGIAIFLLTVLTFAVPDNIVKVNFSILDTKKFLTISIPALVFVLSMYSFGREIYSEKDLAFFYSKKMMIYYGYLSDYLFSAANWCMVIAFCVFKLIFIINLPHWQLEMARIVFLSQFLLAVITTLSIVVKNMNRISNKVAINAIKREGEE
ncbi:hypothetical protein [Lactococcus sp.]|uniref:hypothetical protein n=1 Tax=Lactococcus sp. TaxID=44273 RepID=UPI002FC70F7C